MPQWRVRDVMTTEVITAPRRTPTWSAVQASADRTGSRDERTLTRSAALQ